MQQIPSTSRCLRCFPRGRAAYSTTPYIRAAFSQRNATSEAGTPSVAQQLDMLAQARLKGLKPSADFYRQLFSESSKRLEMYSVAPSDDPDLTIDTALAALRDVQQNQIALDSRAVAALFRIASFHPGIAPSLLAEFSSLSKSTHEAYDSRRHLAHHHLLPDNLVFLVVDAFQHGTAPSIDLIQNAVRSCCEWGMPQLALDIVRECSSVPDISEIVDHSLWMDCLIASAQCQYLEGVQKAWRKVSRRRSFVPDEGLLLQVLDVAARWGVATLAMETLDALSNIGCNAQEHHLVALLETFIASGQVPEAFKVISTIRENGMLPTARIGSSISAVLNTPELVDQAFFGLEDMHKAEEAVDIVAINAVIQASARLGDLRRVRATQASMPDFGLKPNIDTFNIVIDGCIVAKHKALGTTVWSELIESGLAPDVESYEKMIRLCLIPDDYEEAFYYLERMKADGIRPSGATYAMLLQKCSLQEDRRWKLVQDEMESLGYRPDRESLQSRRHVRNRHREP